MKPELYAAVLAFLGQSAQGGSTASEPRPERKPKASVPEAEVEENASLRVALKERETVRRAVSKSWGYLRSQARISGDAVPFSDPIQGGDDLASAVALKWLTHRDPALRDRLIGQGPSHPVPDGRPVTQDQLDRSVHWLSAYRRGGRLPPEKLREYGGALLDLLRETGQGASGSSPAWDVGVTANLLEPILWAVRFGLRPGDTPIVEAMLQQVEAHLGDPALWKGTHFYPQPETFLCQVSELWRQTTPLSAGLRKPLELAVKERWWSSQGPIREPLHRRALPMASLMIAAENLHLGDLNLSAARKALIGLQGIEGAFSPSPYRRMGGTYLGTRTITTLFAVRALEGQPRTGGWGGGTRLEPAGD